MILVGFRGMTALEAEPVMRNIADGIVGAVVLYDVDAETSGTRNIQRPDQVRELVAALKAASEIPLLVTIDAEGGIRHRLREKYGFGPVVGAAEMGQRNDLSLTHSAASVIALQLADLGMDMNLCPAVDLVNPGDAAISAGRRGFASDPAVVAAHAKEWILAHHEHGVLTTVKHFPGLGGIQRPYMPGRGEVVGGWSVDELTPYRALMAEGLLDSVLTNGVTHPELDPDFPSCLSARVVSDLLRRQVGFDGVVMSPPMEMLAIWDVHGFERGTILAVNAGIDLLLYCNQSNAVPYSDHRAPEAVDVIMRAVERGEIAESRIDQACSRILDLKSRLIA